MAGNHVAVWPKVRVTANGKSKIVERGQTVPDGVSDVELDNLVTFGAIAGVSGLSTEEAAEPAAGTEAFILREVGDDMALAQVALDEENAKDKPRARLVGKLEKIVGGS